MVLLIQKLENISNLLIAHEQTTDDFDEDSCSLFTISLYNLKVTN